MAETFCEIPIEGAQAMTIIGALIHMYITYLGISPGNYYFYTQYETLFMLTTIGALSMLIIGAISWSNHDKNEC